MLNLELKLVDKNGDKVEVIFDDIIRVEGRVGVEKLTNQGFPYAGLETNFVLLTTRTAEYEIPRSPENDSQILTYLLSRGAA